MSRISFTRLKRCEAGENSVFPFIRSSQPTGNRIHSETNCDEQANVISFTCRIYPGSRPCYVYLGEARISANVWSTFSRKRSFGREVTWNNEDSDAAFWATLQLVRFWVLSCTSRRYAFEGWLVYGSLNIYVPISPSGSSANVPLCRKHHKSCASVQ